MESHKTTEVNIGDVFADMNLEVDEVISIIKVTCSSLKNSQCEQPEITDIDNTLFSIMGKLNNLKNNLRIMEDGLLITKNN